MCRCRACASVARRRQCSRYCCCAVVAVAASATVAVACAVLLLWPLLLFCRCCAQLQQLSRVRPHPKSYRGTDVEISLPWQSSSSLSSCATVYWVEPTDEGGVGGVRFEPPAMAAHQQTGAASVPIVAGAGAAGAGAAGVAGAAGAVGAAAASVAPPPPPALTPTSGDLGLEPAAADGGDGNVASWDWARALLQSQAVRPGGVLAVVIRYGSCLCKAINFVA